MSARRGAAAAWSARTTAAEAGRVARPGSRRDLARVGADQVEPVAAQQLHGRCHRVRAPATTSASTKTSDGARRVGAARPAAGRRAACRASRTAAGRRATRRTLGSSPDHPLDVSTVPSRRAVVQHHELEPSAASSSTASRARRPGSIRCASSRTGSSSEHRLARRLAGRVRGRRSRAQVDQRVGGERAGQEAAGEGGPAHRPLGPHAALPSGEHGPGRGRGRPNAPSSTPPHSATPGRPKNAALPSDRAGPGPGEQQRPVRPRPATGSSARRGSSAQDRLGQRHQQHGRRASQPTRLVRGTAGHSGSPGRGWAPVQACRPRPSAGPGTRPTPARASAGDAPARKPCAPTVLAEADPPAPGRAAGTDRLIISQARGTRTGTPGERAARAGASSRSGRTATRGHAQISTAKAPTTTTSDQPPGPGPPRAPRGHASRTRRRRPGR